MCACISENSDWAAQGIQVEARDSVTKIWFRHKNKAKKCLVFGSYFLQPTHSFPASSALFRAERPTSMGCMEVPFFSQACSRMHCVAFWGEPGGKTELPCESQVSLSMLKWDVKPGKHHGLAVKTWFWHAFLFLKAFKFRPQYLRISYVQGLLELNSCESLLFLQLVFGGILTLSLEIREMTDHSLFVQIPPPPFFVYPKEKKPKTEFYIWGRKFINTTAVFQTSTVLTDFPENQIPATSTAFMNSSL